ncbi:hypothetical protein Tco_1238373 [Tanacetum coccineum]
MPRCLDLVYASNSYVIADMMVVHYQIARDLQHARDMMNLCQKFTDKVMEMRELIVELQSLHASRVAMASVAQLKRLQTADLRKARMLMRMSGKFTKSCLER